MRRGPESEGPSLSVSSEAACGQLLGLSLGPGEKDPAGCPGVSKEDPLPAEPGSKVWAVSGP